MKHDAKKIALALLLVVASAGIGYAVTSEYVLTDGVHLQADDGPEIELDEDVDLQAQHPFPDSNTVDLYPHGTVSSDGHTYASVSGLEEDWTHLESLDVDGSTLEADLDGKNKIEMSGDLRDLSYRGVDLDDDSGEIDLVSSGSDFEIVVHGLQADTNVNAIDTDTGNVIDETETDDSGVATFDALPSGSYEMTIADAPDELVVRDETDPDTILDDDDIDLEVRFFATDQVYTRTASNGTVNLAGLPNEGMIVTVSEENDDFVSQSIYIDSIVDQQDVYLLPGTEPSAEVRFQLDDQTGNYDPDSTRLEIQKPITRDGETTYHVVAGDFFSPSGEVPFILADDERYRLSVVNEDDDRRVLGTYRVEGSDVETLPIGSVQIASDAESGAAFAASVKEAPDSSDHEHEIRVEYQDPAEKTDSIDVEIVSGDGETLRPLTREDGPFGTYAETYPVEGWSPEEDSATVTVSAIRDGETIDHERVVGDVPEIFGTQTALHPQTLELIGWVGLIALIGFLTIQSPVIAALVGAGFAALLTVLGILPIPMIAVGLAGSVAVLFALGGDRL